MPLEALYSLMKEQFEDDDAGRNILDGAETLRTGRGSKGPNLVLVT